MGKIIEPLPVELWIEAGNLLKESKNTFRKMEKVLSGHIPVPLLDQVLQAREKNFLKLQSRLEEEMFRQYPNLPRKAIRIFYREDPYENCD